MSTTTKNYGLVKPELTDVADITAMNENWDTIDEELENRVKKTGDTLTGKLTIKNDSPSVTLLNNGNGRNSTFETTGAGIFQLNNTLNTSNRTYLRLLPETSTDENLLQLRKVVDGVSKDYKVYHEGNKPAWVEWSNHLAMHDCSNTDLNTLKTSGLYFGYEGMTNAAVNEISVIEVIPYSNDWVLQRQTRLTDGKTYCRYFTSGTTWSAWFSVLTTLHKASPSNIAEGTFSGYVAANKNGQYYGTSLLRNTKIVSTDTNPTVDGEIYWTYN